MEETNQELISVIVPVYKVEKYLDRCLNSIVNQTYKNLEIILVDDSSPDRCPEMCDEWAKRDNRIQVIHKENGGLSSARNAGMRAMTGSLITFVDSDDWLYLDAINIMYRLMSTYQADMVIGEMRTCKEKIKAEPKTKMQIEVWDQKAGLDFFFRVHGEKSRYGVWGRLIKENVLQEFEFPEGKINEDVPAAYWMALKSERTVYTNEKVYNYFVNNNGITRSKFTEKDMDLLEMWKIVIEWTKQYSPKHQHACTMNYKRGYFTLLSKMCMYGYDRRDTRIEKIKKDLRGKVRSNYWELLKWNMPLGRKILLTLVCIV